MNDWEKLAQNTFYLFVGGVSIGIEQAGKTLQELGEQTQQIAEAIQKQGETLYQNISEGFQDGLGVMQENRPTEKVRQRLLTILNGDLPTAERLVENEKLKNPGNSENWYWEKVIHDLERDRGR